MDNSNEVNKCRYKCITRLDKKTVTGKTDYKDRYCYRILDTVSGKVATLDGLMIKNELRKGTKIDGMRLSADGRILLKELKSINTVVTPSSVKVGNKGKKQSQCVDFSLVSEKNSA